MDFDAKLNRRHRNDWSGQQIEMEVTDDGQRVMRVVVSRSDGYREGEPSTYTVTVVSSVGSDLVEVTLRDLFGHVKVAQ